MKITHIDAATGLTTETTVTESELIESIGEAVSVKALDQIIKENVALKKSAIAKLAELGLTEDEAKAIIG